MGAEIRENLLKELDFVMEASNAARAKKNLSNMKNVYVPKTIPVYYEININNYFLGINYKKNINNGIY
jgi:predicted unusual protein kinase regulating ubiquinone biosynthesis (AarF/ABC1/UbiB family)